MPKGIPNNRYSGELKQKIIEAMINEKLSYQEATRRFEIAGHEAFQKISDNSGLLFHSDQGWHYRHKQYRRMLEEKGVQQCMSRKGNCYGNSVMANFFGHLKSELLYLQELESIEHFKQELIEYIDYYNNRRIKARLKGLPPTLHRQQALSAA